MSADLIARLHREHNIRKQFERDHAGPKMVEFSKVLMCMPLLFLSGILFGVGIMQVLSK